MRANWGGGGNLSGTFESLYDAWSARAEAAAQRNLRREEEEQAAKDSDTYDKWKNGLITDKQWLDYIAQRVKETKGDPTEHQQWIETQREHTFAIRDAQAESAYESGDISANALIGYYRNRMKHVKNNSPEYRQLLSRYWQIVDVRDSDAMYKDAERIIDNIERGHASYRDLLNYYIEKRKTVRKNSDLYRQLTREIDSVQDIVDRVGGAGGSGGGGGSRGGGGGGFRSDISSAINDAIVMRARNGSVYDPTGQDPIPSLTQLAKQDIDDYKNALIADISRLDEIYEQELDDQNAEYFVDRISGAKIPNTPEMMRQLDNMYLRQEEMLFGIAWSNGDWDDAQTALHYRQEHVRKNMQRHNTENYQDVWNEQLNGSLAAYAAASAISDPYERARAYQDITANLNAHADAILYDLGTVKTGGLTEDVDEDKASKSGVAVTRHQKTPEEKVDKELREQVEFTKNLFTAFADPSLDINTRQQMISDLSDQRPVNYVLTTEQIDAYANGATPGTTTDAPAIGVMETYAAQVGINTVGPDGRPAFSFMQDESGLVRAIPTQAVDAIKSDPNAPQMVMTMERIGGRTQYVWRPVTGQESSYDVWVDSDGKIMTENDLGQYELGDLIRMEQQGEIARKSIGEGWASITMADGRKWFQDPETRLWYADRVPVNVELDDTGAVVVDATGRVKMDVQRWASEAGVPMPFTGITTKEAQKGLEVAVDNGYISMDDFYTRDQDGVSTFEHPGIEGRYWDPADALVNDATEARVFARANREGMLRGKIDEEMEKFKLRQEKRRQARAEAYLEENFTAEQERLFRKMNPETDIMEYAATQAEASPTFGLATDPKIRFGPEPEQDVGTASVGRPNMPAMPTRARLSEEKAKTADLPTIAFPTATSGQALAPILPKPPRPNLPEFPEPKMPHKKKSPPPIKAADTRRNNFREF